MPGMTTRDSLLRAILADPASDARRLVYADWLEEYGGESDRLRAEFIRVQVELARLEGRDVRAVVPSGETLAAILGATLEWQRANLRRRERELYHHHFRQWAAPNAHLYLTFHVGTDDGRRGNSWCVYRRGFLAEVGLALADFAEDNALALFSAHPVEAVTLTDREPANLTAERFNWAADEGMDDPGRCFGPAHIPWALAVPHLIGATVRRGTGLQWLFYYPSERAACDSLSAACVAYGRDLAGLAALSRAG